MGQTSAVFLMIAGIGLLGTVTATLAAWFADKLQNRTDEDLQDVSDQVTALRADIAALRADIANLRPPSTNPPPEGPAAL